MNYPVFNQRGQTLMEREAPALRRLGLVVLVGWLVVLVVLVLIFH